MRFVLLAFVSFFMLCCENSDTPDADADFEYVITGKVTGHEGVKLALIPENASTEERLTAVVKDGVFRFAGKSELLQPAELRFEDEITGLNGSYATTMVFLEPGNITLNLEITGEEGKYRFSTQTYQQGEKNLELLNIFPEFRKAVGGSSLVIGDSVKNDSMVRLVYPVARERVLAFFADQFETGSPEISAYMFVEVVIKGLNNKGMFDKNNLKLVDIKKISQLSYRVDSLSVHSEKYQLITDAVEQLNSSNTSARFVDFTASDEDFTDVTISTILDQNQYTLLYFWFTECKPCRLFNLGMKYNYADLQAKGIEVIGVNVDETREKWNKSSLQDDIQWVNLYAGDKSGLEAKYGIRGFPFKVLFDKNYEPVDRKMKSVEDIMLWMAEVE